MKVWNQVGIVGAGTMGNGIAQACASAGLRATMMDVSASALERGMGTVSKSLERLVSKEKITSEQRDAALGRLATTSELQGLADCDLVIEAVFEDMDLKKTIFTKLDEICKDGAILATNTSALNIDEIAAVTKRPQDVIGLHFFSPANVMKLLEIVRADETADDVVATSMDLAKKIGKIAALVGVCPGFVGNRILASRQLQAMDMVNRGVMPWDVDAAFNEFGFKMGPFQMSDLAGLDLGWKKGAKTASPIRDALCEMDRRGQKTGAGYYDYDENMQRTPSDVTAKVIAEVTGVEPGASSLSSQEIIEICIYPMINEAVKIMEENKAQRPSDVDVIWAYVYGWPGDKGGPMFYGDLVGAEKILATMQSLAADNPAIQPAKTLEKLAKEGGKFVALDLGGLKTG